ncbi:MAG: APC family permease [Cyclobacteriaceae bacterium]
MAGKNPRMSMISAATMGVGTMVGAGIFALLGEAAEIAGNLLYLPFIFAGLISLLIGYSYAKLGAAFPSMGGPVEYLIQGFGTGISSGAFNVLYYFAMISGIAMVSRAFGNYAAALMPSGFTENFSLLFTGGIILAFTLLNMIGSSAVSHVEKWIVAIKVGILVIFACLGLYYMQMDLLIPNRNDAWGDILDATGIVFFAFTGFGIITNTAEDLSNPSKELPIAIYLSIGSVLIIYMMICFALIGNLSYSQIVSSKEYALAEAAKPFLGNLGFKVMGVAALLSTASAINASLYGAANISFTIAKMGELPSFFERHLWKNSTDGLIISSGLVLAMALFMDLDSIASVGSAVILIIYTLINIGHLRIIKKTGANKWMVIGALVIGLLVLGYFLNYKYHDDPLVIYLLLIAIGAGYLIEVVMQKVIGRRLTKGIKNTRQ